MIHVVKDDITDMEVDAFVFYARPDLQLGSGYGTAISVRGGPKIQEELNTIGSKNVGDAVTTGAGNLKAKHIIHAVGPAFQEDDIINKLQTTLESALNQAIERGIKSLAMPPLGFGFYGLPMDQVSKITGSVLSEFTKKDTGIKDIFIVVRDFWEADQIKANLDSVE